TQYQRWVKLARAQGIPMTPALSSPVPNREYAHLRIMQAITCRGSASKEQVAMMLKQLLKLTEQPEYLDATDGLAAAVCHYLQSNVPAAASGVKSWKEFIGKNPGRIRK